MTENESTKKYKIWENLDKLGSGKSINMVQLAKASDCTLSYLSVNLRYAFESGFLKMNEDGNYVKKKDFPDYEEFKNKINEKYNTYRRTVRATQSTRPRLPKEFKIDETTILKVIKAIIQENVEQKAKMKKVIAYAKKMKKERDEVIEAMEDFE